MTVVRNTELSAQTSSPISRVKVVIEALGPAALTSGTGSLSVASVLYTGSDGKWEADLYPSSQITPTPGAYSVTRIYPASSGEQKHIDFIIVPNSGPAEFQNTVVSRPEAPPLSQSELQLHLQHPDPHLQYVTDSALEDRLDDFDLPDVSDASTTVKGIVKLAGDFEGTADAPKIKDSTVARYSLSNLGAPLANLPLGGYKLTGMAKGLAATDGATVQNVLDQAAVVVPGTAYGPPTTGTYVAGAVARSTTSNRLWVCTTGGTPGTWTTAQITTISATAPLNPVINDIWKKPVT